MRKVLMAGGAIAVALASVPAVADVKAGVDAWRVGDYRAAVDQWRPLAIAGDPDAQYNLAQAYKLGRGVPVDPAMAESWFGKAAVQGHEQAQENYGIALFQDGKKADAVPWLEKAVGRDAPRAELVYGTMLFNGDGVQRDYPRAYALMTRAAAARGTAPGLQSASETLSQMDQYVSPADRERGTALAQQFAARANSPQLAQTGAEGGVADVPPSRANTARPTDMRVPRGETRVAAAPGRDNTVPSPRAATPPREIARNDARPTPPERPQERPAPAKPQPARERVAAREPAPVRAAPPARVTGQGWRVQLGAFSEAGNAHALWSRLSSHFAGVGPAYVNAGRVTRLQVRPYRSKADAQHACAAAHVSCVIVAP